MHTYYQSPWDRPQWPPVSPAFWCSVLPSNKKPGGRNTSYFRIPAKLVLQSLANYCASCCHHKWCCEERPLVHAPSPPSFLSQPSRLTMTSLTGVTITNIPAAKIMEPGSGSRRHEFPSCTTLGQPHNLLGIITPLPWQCHGWTRGQKQVLCKILGATRFAVLLFLVGVEKKGRAQASHKESKRHPQVPGRPWDGLMNAWPGCHDPWVSQK
jgi:hypothetical protein